jgi:hypothetical protein
VTDGEGNINPESVSQLTSARSAGFMPDIVIIPNRNKNATAQVNALMANIPSSLYARIWFKIIWAYTFSPESNCAYVQELINSIKLKGKNSGVYVYLSSWALYFGDQYACPAPASQPLYYEAYSTTCDFHDFVPIGGWTKPSMADCNLHEHSCGIYLWSIFL